MTLSAFVLAAPAFAQPASFGQSPDLVKYSEGYDSQDPTDMLNYHNGNHLNRPSSLAGQGSDALPMRDGAKALVNRTGSNGGR